MSAPLLLHCMACGDARELGEDRRHCRCGLSWGRMVDGDVVVAGPGRVRRSAGPAADRDEVPVHRPSVLVPF